MSVMTDFPAPGISELRAALERIRPLLPPSPLLQSAALDAALGCQALLKCENRQHTGAFKLRGATNAIARLRESGVQADVATHSSGNHGAALALAAQRDGRRAVVVMPKNCVPAKIRAVRQFGGEVILCAPNQAARELGLSELVAQGYWPIPPYEHPDIIAGQGTIVFELLEQAADLDALVTPLGGGGLLAGCAIAARALRPSMAVYGAEPEGAADGEASLRAGQRVSQWQPDTVADGLRALIGGVNFAIIREHVDDILLCTETQIVEAMRLVFETTGMAIEPSSAVAVAVVRSHPERFQDRRIALVITGGNVDLERFPWLEAAP
jgi:threonine dehydratase